MIKKGFTILESTFSIMILSIVISFGVYLSSKSFDSFNRFSLMNLAYMQHENRLNLLLNLIKSNQLKFPNHFEVCKLTSIQTERFEDCINLTSFQIFNDLDHQVVQINDGRAIDATSLFCQDENCSSFDFKESEFKEYPIYTYLNGDLESGNLLIQTTYEFKNIEYSINTNLKV